MNVEITEEQLLELERLATLGRLLAGVAHDLKAPIGSLLSNRDTASRLLDRLDKAVADGGAEDSRRLLAGLRELARVDQIAGDRITHLVRSLKIVSRAGDCKQVETGVDEIAGSAVELVKAQFGKRIEFVTDFGPMPGLRCQPQLLSHAIINLLTNATEAIEGAGRITVGARAEGGEAHIWVSDTGRGIRDEDKPKILKKGFTTKPVGAGTGLGLLIVRRAVEEHGGSIAFESEWGRGSVFHVRIPFEQQDRGAESRA